MVGFALIAVSAILVMLGISTWTGQPPAVLITAAILSVVLGMGHSILGEMRLIVPILRLDGLPRIRGSRRPARVILRFAWHLTTLLWLGQAAVLAYMGFVPGAISLPFLWMTVAIFGLSGAVALIATRGAHTSWVYFFSIAALAATAISRASSATVLPIP